MLNLVKINYESEEKFYNLICKGLTDRKTGIKYFFVGQTASMARRGIAYAVPAMSAYDADCKTFSRTASMARQGIFAFTIPQ